MSEQIRVAAVAWKLRHVRRDGHYLGHFHDLVSIAHDEGADVVVFPENHSLELLGLASDLEEKDVPAFLIQFSNEIEKWIERISASSGVTIVGGSHLRETPQGIKNVCVVGHPKDGLTLVEKNNLTTYEKEVWRLAPGVGLAALPDPRLGVTICYDSEFPESGRALAESGVVVQAVPAFTETRRGFQRVRWCCLARAVENQVFVVHSSLVGSLGREPVPATFGSSAIIAPSIEPFPEEAILAETNLDEEGVVVRTLSIDQLREARDQGDVRNWNDRLASSWNVLKTKD